MWFKELLYKYVERTMCAHELFFKSRKLQMYKYMCFSFFFGGGSGGGGYLYDWMRKACEIKYEYWKYNDTYCD